MSASLGGTDPVLPTGTGALRRRTTCRVCGHRLFDLALSLVATPPGNAFVRAEQCGAPQDRYPLDVYVCLQCRHAQLLDVVDPLALFEHHIPAYRFKARLADHLRGLAAELIDTFKPAAEALVVDIGCNDGTFLKVFEKAGLRVQGIEVAVDRARDAVAEGVQTFPGLFKPPIAERIEESRGRAVIVFANRTLAEADDPTEFMQAVSDLLSRTGVFVFEVPYLLDIIENRLIDRFVHRTLAYHTVNSLSSLFPAAGFDLFSIRRPVTRPATIRGYVQRAGGPYRPDGSVDDALAFERTRGVDSALCLKGLADALSPLADGVGRLAADIRADGGRLAAHGVGPGATTLLYQMGLGRDEVEFLIDPSGEEAGFFSPGLHIPVLGPEALAERQPDWLLVLSWPTDLTGIPGGDAFRAAGGRLIAPLPAPEIR